MASEANAIFCRRASSFEGRPFFFSGSATAGAAAAEDDPDTCPPLLNADGSLPEGAMGGGGDTGALIGRTLNLLIY